MSEYYCTNCNADLESQNGFSPDLSYWTCECCGIFLGNPNDPDFDMLPGTVWICDECGACLNKQAGFSDEFDTWTCDECGYENKIDPSEVYETEYHYRKAKRRKERFDRFNNWLENVADEIERNNNEDTYQEIHYETRSVNPKAEKIKKFLVCFFLFIGLLGLSYYEYIHMIPICLSSTEIIGSNYDDVITKIKNNGFVFLIPSNIKDLKLVDMDKDYEVSEIKVAWMNSFSEDMLIPYNVPIFITYHSLEEIVVPIGSKEVKNKNYQEVKQQFIDAGFINIKEEVLYDIVTGWITEDEEIKLVTIEGNKNYNIESKYRPDAEVVITYHTYKNKKPKD